MQSCRFQHILAVISIAATNVCWKKIIINVICTKKPSEMNSSFSIKATGYNFSNAPATRKKMASFLHIILIEICIFGPLN